MMLIHIFIINFWFSVPLVMALVCVHERGAITYVLEAELLIAVCPLFLQLSSAELSFGNPGYGLHMVFYVLSGNDTSSHPDAEQCHDSDSTRNPIWEICLKQAILEYEKEE
jgi:hypothetical protein